MQDPKTMKRAWYGWAVIVLLLISIPFACTVSEAQEVEDARCGNGWCIVKQSTLIELLKGLQKLAAQADQLQELCGWRKP